MMRHYLQMKEQYPDCFLFYRLGDFYEMFFEDAIEGSKIMELTLTGRDCGLPERAPMCGVPYHSVDTYVQRLISRGYKVAICEQMEDPALAKGLVERSVIRVITPGTVIEEKLLDAGKNNYLLSVYASRNGYGYAYADVSTGEFKAGEIRGKEPEAALLDEITRIGPSPVAHVLWEHGAGGSNPLTPTRCGPVVKRLRHRPFTAVTGVRFSSGSPFPSGN